MARPQRRNREEARDRSDKDTKAPKRASNNASAAGMELGGDELLKLVEAAEKKSQDFVGALQRASWERSIKAFHNQHHDGSKYRHDLFKQRTKIFRPKTRSAVRKNLAAGAAALFSNADVVSVQAQNDSDPIKAASAEVLKQDLNYRLDRTSAKSGVPWFLMSMGALLDTQLHAVCASKQYWDYEAVDSEKEYEIVEHELDGETGEPILDEETGRPAERVVGTETETVTRIVRDRPFVELFPPEHVLIDPSAPWYDPIQGSPYLIARMPMTVDQVQTMTRNPGKSKMKWLELDEDTLAQVVGDYDMKGVRLARDDGQDRYDQDRTGGLERTTIIWVYEVFFRLEGVDWHFWTAGTRAFLSDVRKCEESYPEQFGDRPYTFGYGSIESHRVYPMSAVESWQQMQVEANDLINLRLDILKQSLAPIAKVKQGTMFDWKQLQNIGQPNATVLVRNPDDLQFDRAPGAGADSYQEMNNLNVDFDELSGTFSAGSVQSNRQLNETVGGMRLLSGSSSAITEFDLRVWVETWCEPTIRQVVRLIQYWETDETLLAIAGEKAKIFERYGVNELTDKDLQSEVTVRVNVGIGAADPMQRIQKLGMGLQMLAQSLPYMDKPMKVKGEELAKEIMGAIGYNDGMRFFEVVDPAQQDPAEDPAMQEIMINAKLEQAKLMMQERIAQAGNENKLQVEQMKGRMQILEAIIREEAEQRRMTMTDDIERARLQGEHLMQLYDINGRHGLEREKVGAQERIAQNRDRTQESIGRERSQIQERSGQRQTMANMVNNRERNELARRDSERRERIERERLSVAERTNREKIKSGERTAREGFKAKSAAAAKRPAPKAAKR